MKFKSTVACALGLSLCALAFQANATFLIPVTDYAMLMQRIEDDLAAATNAAKKMVNLDAIMQTYNAGRDSTINAVNNGSANSVARMNQVLADIQNATQMEKALPTRDACTTTIGGAALTDLACGDPSTQEDYESTMDRITSSVVGMYTAASRTTSRITGMVTSASTTGTGIVVKTESQKKYDQYLAKQIEIYDQLKAWADAGKESASLDPRQLLPMGNYNPQFNEEDQQMAQVYAYVTYPPYVRKNPVDPTAAQEFMAELRKKNDMGVVGSVINRQIEMRMPPQPGKPSKLLAIEAQTAMRFTDQGTLSTDDQSWLTRVTQDNSYSTSAINREGAIMKSIKVRQMIDRYESSLVREQMLATYMLGILDNPSNKL
jgi:hypothetical protein